PIMKDKLFFYFDYLRTSDHEANNNNLNIPVKAFSTPVPCTTGGGECIDLSSAINGSPTTGAGIIYDPATGNANGTGRTRFANNQIPLSRVNPISLKILQMLPAPNRPVANNYTLANDYNANLAFVKSSDTYDAKVDYSLTEKDRLSARFSYQKVNTIQAPVFGSFLGGPAQGAFEATGNVTSYSTGLNYNHTFSPTLLTEVRLGVGHLHNSANPTNYGKNDADTLGVPGVNIAGQPFTSGQVGVSIGTYSSPIIGYAASVPWIRAEANIDMVNHWTKVLHNHTVKFGADVRRVRDDLLQDQTFSPRGVETFGENQTSIPGATANVANDTASFLLDIPNSVGRDLNTFFPAYRDWWVFVFAGDKWQATSKLTLDLGVRWEFYPPATPKVKAGFSQYDYVNNQLLLAGVGGIPRNAGINTQYTFFAPRTGFAYRATDETVVRGGFGISYTQFPDNNYLYNFPVRSNNSFNTVNSYGPAVLADGVTVPTFQFGFPAPVPVPIPVNGIIPTNTSQLVAQNYFTVPKNYKNPYVMSYNLAVQQALPHQFSLQLAFVGNHGVRIATNQNINLPSTYNTGAAGDPEYNLPNALPGSKLHRTASTNDIFLGNSSNYNSLQIQLQRRFTGGLSSSSAFTWGKAFDYQQGDDGGLTFFINTRRNYAPADFDRRLNFEQSFTYELPIGRGHRWMSSGMGATILGGWKLAGIVSIVSGTPIANGLTANGGTLNTPGTQQDVNQVGPYRTPKKVGSGNQWFDKTAFAQPRGCLGVDPVTHVAPPCTGIVGVEIGNTGRNQFYGPGFVQDNLSAFKDFKFTERFVLNARVDAFQLSNTPQFGNPGNSITSSNFGQVTGTLGSGSGVNGIGGGRALQLSAKLSF
ncbi:MAG: TonB-dependent receptor, partial [Acidobacteriota bacterium]|nr:TonB-dependent receptor [Acidobacteriota bacterium]